MSEQSSDVTEGSGTKLLPCPFCGGKADHHRIGNSHTKSRATKIWCSECRFTKTVGAIRHDLNWTDAKAFEAWNSRRLVPAGGSRPLRDILWERMRQRAVEGWTRDHDDTHISGEMALAAGCYAVASTRTEEHWLETIFVRYWPWARSWWKPKDPRSNLVRAGALILAEIERIDRAAAKHGDTPSADGTASLFTSSLNTSSLPQITSIDARVKELETALIAALPILGWRNYSDSEIQQEIELGNGFAVVIAQCRKALSQGSPGQ